MAGSGPPGGGRVAVTGSLADWQSGTGSFTADCQCEQRAPSRPGVGTGQPAGLLAAALLKAKRRWSSTISVADHGNCKIALYFVIVHNNRSNNNQACSVMAASDKRPSNFDIENA